MLKFMKYYCLILTALFLSGCLPKPYNPYKFLYNTYKAREVFSKLGVGGDDTVYFFYRDCGGRGIDTFPVDDEILFHSFNSFESFNNWANVQSRHSFNPYKNFLLKKFPVKEKIHFEGLGELEQKRSCMRCL